ncbi:hypothetical protein TH25_14385 [Thalassospira profundimaris]|uniref:Uncharacterized protein n=1 Tax=Thalassospira profundimaris TaxID=502049 RepID=A0A367X6Q8_9PROT|nr:hypothetical protein TH25_14385 [Thalassospira profundimaris]
MRLAAMCRGLQRQADIAVLVARHVSDAQAFIYVMLFARLPDVPWLVCLPFLVRWINGPVSLPYVLARAGDNKTGGSRLYGADFKLNRLSKRPVYEVPDARGLSGRDAHSAQEPS